MISTRRRNRTAALAVALALGAAGVAEAQNVTVTQPPTMSGTMRVGDTLTASGGVWNGPPGSRTRWVWVRCSTNQPNDTLSESKRNAPSTCNWLSSWNYRYTLTNDDVNSYMRLGIHAWWADNDTYVDDWMVTRPGARVVPRATPVPTPVPPPVPTVAPTPVPTPVATPTPAPTFDTAAATPVPTNGEVLQETARSRRVIRPFPVVRMKGRLTSSGASVQVFSVRAPRAAKVSVRCTGRSCPASRWSRSARKSRLTRMTRFERGLRAGVKITVSVTRRGYVGKRTTFVIRRGVAPLRSDHCLSAKGRITRCPSGVS